MRLGFIGTGELASAIVTGLCSSDIELDSIQLSPRNFAIATDLRQRFQRVSIASSNQEVVDGCDTVIIAVRPPVARSVLSDLHFRPSHCIISVVSGLPLRRLSELVLPASRIARAVPLPSTAMRIGPTAIYPAEPLADQIFAAIGTVFEVEFEDEFEAICAATATIAASYAFLNAIAAWLSRNGVAEPKARDYISRMFLGLTKTSVDAPEETFQSLSNHHATAGGTNEQVLKHMVEHEFVDNVSRGLDAVLRRITTPRD
jgi:pyrroline-5-carboxylate reductase